PWGLRVSVDRGGDFRLDPGVCPRLAPAGAGAGRRGGRLPRYRPAPEVPGPVHPRAEARQPGPRPQLHVAVLCCSSPDPGRTTALIRYGPIGNTPKSAEETRCR